MANILYILVQHLKWMATSLEWQENSYLRKRNSFLATIGKSGWRWCCRLTTTIVAIINNYFPFYFLFRDLFS